MMKSGAMELRLGSPAGLWERVVGNSTAPAGDAWGCRTLSHVSLDRLRIGECRMPLGYIRWRSFLPYEIRKARAVGQDGRENERAIRKLEEGKEKQ